MLVKFDIHTCTPFVLSSYEVRVDNCMPIRLMNTELNSQTHVHDEKNMIDILGEVCALFESRNNTSQRGTLIRHKRNNSSCKYDMLD